MRPLAETGTRGGSFWLLVVASTAGHLVNGASTPVVPRLAQDELGADPAQAGILVSLAAFASIAAMPISGALTDRWGPRRVLIAAGALAVVGLGVVLATLSTTSLGTSRLLFGAGNAAVATALTSWVVAEIPAAQRGRALSLFGLSVWVGLALGPVLGENLYQVAGYRAVWATVAGIQLAGLLVALVARSGRVAQHDREHASTVALGQTVLQAVARPGAVGLVAWAGEGFMIAFLIQHLIGQGLDDRGLLGAANVFTVFAASVIGARLLLGGLPDRFGPAATARVSLVVLASGFGVLAIASDFGLASLGAVLVGVGYSPLFPALTMLTTRGLDRTRRSTGVGAFSAFTSAGYALGSLLGGVLVAGVGSGAALGALALLQLAAVPLLRRERRRGPAAIAVEPPLV